MDKEIQQLIDRALAGDKKAYDKLKRLCQLGKAVDAAFTKIYSKPRPKLKLIK